VSAPAATPVGYRHLYLHVPFCARRCSYCDFAIAVRRQVPWRAFANSVDAELRTRGAAQSCEVLTTLYLGGGTPSRLGGEGIERLFETLHQHIRLEAQAEVTLEVNPEDVSPEAVAAWRRAGVNRVSLGVQSFNDRVLSWMHRVHDADAALRAVDTLRAGGIDAMSLDLIFAAPDNLERDWSDDITRLLSLDPDHISLYGLTIEPHTPLGRWQARGEVEEASEDVYERQFLESHERLRAAGFEHYEVSNFARPGRRARHNSAYWQNVPYLGIGPSAHGFDGSERRWNHAALAAWELALSAGLDPLDGAETLTSPNREAEMVYLGLRTIDGLELRDGEEARVATWRRQGWIESVDETAGSRIRCTASGWLRLDAMATDLTALRSRS
jgi:oxygen-independent coproporphyrinogen-3 oxidase